MDGEHGGHRPGRKGISVEPGRSGTLVYGFTQPGRLEIGCHQPGHYAAGMIAEIRVR
jgi:uncharacterized cupredoxin-like copper-binding protein